MHPSYLALSDWRASRLCQPCSQLHTDIQPCLKPGPWGAETGSKSYFPTRYCNSLVCLHAAVHIKKTQRLTWSWVPSSVMRCCESVCSGCPSLSQEMAGAGFPVVSQWRTTVLLTTAPISSMNSSVAPMITGGAKEVKTANNPPINYFVQQAMRKQLYFAKKKTCKTWPNLNGSAQNMTRIIVTIRPLSPSDSILPGPVASGLRITRLNFPLRWLDSRLRLNIASKTRRSSLITMAKTQGCLEWLWAWQVSLGAAAVEGWSSTLKGDVNISSRWKWHSEIRIFTFATRRLKIFSNLTCFFLKTVSHSLNKLDVIHV